MPLDSERERLAGNLDRLGDVVGDGGTGDFEPVGDPVEALVVVGVHDDAFRSADAGDP